MLKRYLLALIAVLFALNINPLSAAAETKVGIILPYSGDFAKYGSLVRKGIEAGRGKDIRLIYEDEACNSAAAVRAYKKLSAVDGVKFFLGPCCGSPQTAVASLVRASKQLVLLGSSASEDLFERSGRRMLSSQPSIESESRFIAGEMNRLGYQSVVIVFDENDFSRAHEKAFRGSFKGKSVETIALTPGDASSYKAAALRIKQQNPSVIYSPDAAPLMLGLLKELAAIGFRDKPVWSVYSAQSAEVKQAVEASGMKLTYSYPEIGEEDALEYFPRKAMELISDAAGRCGEDTGCASAYLLRAYPFSAAGALDTKLILKHIPDGAGAS